MIRNLIFFAVLLLLFFNSASLALGGESDPVLEEEKPMEFTDVVPAPQRAKPKRVVPRILARNNLPSRCTKLNGEKVFITAPGNHGWGTVIGRIDDQKILASLRQSQANGRRIGLLLSGHDRILEGTLFKATLDDRYRRIIYLPDVNENQYLIQVSKQKVVFRGDRQTTEGSEGLYLGSCDVPFKENL